jgi:hypothetical protein
MREIKTTTEIIDALGGNLVVARLTSAKAKSVSRWRVTSFPANTFLLLKSELLRRGITAPDHLWSMREPLAARRKRSA